MYLDRQLSSKLQRLCEAFPVTVISGARQVGKTTLVRHLFPGFDYVVFDPTIDIENARGEPDLFLRNHPAPLILDEIQYAPEVVAALKRRVDAGGAQPGQYLVTGSQQWQVMRSLSESLAGRAAFLDLEGLSLQEMAGCGGTPGWLENWLDDAAGCVAAWPRDVPHRPLWDWLWRGFLPGAQTLSNDLVPDFWAGYQRTYIERDARLAGEVNDWQQFGMFLRLVSALTSQEINYSQLGREIGMTPQSARRWLDVLRGTFQWHEVPAFKGNLIKRVSGKPKGYLADTGLVCHLARLGSSPALGGHPLLGALFETAMVHEIRKQNATLSRGGAFHHWRTAGGAEVDLILERDGWLHPFEIKLTTHPTKRDASGITALRQAYPHLQIAKAAILCATDRPYWLADDVAALPWHAPGAH